MLTPKGISLSTLALYAVVVLSLVISYVFVFSYNHHNVQFMGGDAQDYYSSLPATFIHHNLNAQNANQWYLLQTNEGVINVHPVGIALLQLPFFLSALLITSVGNGAVDGYSFPFQLAIATAALVYLVIGLNYLRRLLLDLNFSQGLTAVVLLLLFFGTNLMHYTLAEPGMSHVYSFALLSAYLFYTHAVLRNYAKKNLLLLGVVIGLVLLVRPNNLLFLPLGLLWFKNWSEAKTFFSSVIRNKTFYLSLTLAAAILLIQPLVWLMQSGSLFQNTYKRDGFYWSNPQLKEMLFGFDNGFFIYVPLCLLLVAGLLPLFKQQRFAFVVLAGTMFVWFYFFSCYWAYTYFDGFGIRVLVDYYSVFGVLAAYLFSAIKGKLVLQGSVYAVAALAVVLNFIYTYQANRSILLRAGMNYKMWRYVFLKTEAVYQNCLGGSYEMKPYAAAEAPLLVTDSVRSDLPFDFSGKEFGPALTSIQLPKASKRFRVELDIARQEKAFGESDAALLIISVDNSSTRSNKAYVNFKLNETPATNCCESVEFNYAANVVGDFEQGDKVSIYVWNQHQRKFYLEKLAVRLYDYNYNLN